MTDVREELTLGPAGCFSCLLGPTQFVLRVFELGNIPNDAREIAARPEAEFTQR